MGGSCLSDNLKPISEGTEANLRTILYSVESMNLDHNRQSRARGKRLRVIHQTVLPVSLGLKDTVVRAYRTDPVQVRS